MQTTTGLPSNDYWFASPPYIATQPPAALFTLHSPAKCTSSPLNSLLLLPEKPHLPQEDEIFFAPCNSLAYGEMNATQRAVLRNILR